MRRFTHSSWADTSRGSRRFDKRPMGSGQPAKETNDSYPETAHEFVVTLGGVCSSLCLHSEIVEKELRALRVVSCDQLSDTEHDLRLLWWQLPL